MLFLVLNKLFNKNLSKCNRFSKTINTSLQPSITRKNCEYISDALLFMKMYHYTAMSTKMAASSTSHTRDLLYIVP